MATRIRLRRMGSKGRPFYRVVVADQRSPRDGRFIENIGQVPPAQRPLADRDRRGARAVLAPGRRPALRPGAQPDEKVGIWEPSSRSARRPPGETKPERPAKEKMSKKAQAKAAEAQKAPAAPAARRRSSQPRPRARCRAAEEPAAEPSDEPSRAQRPRPRRRQRPEVKELVEFLCRELVDDPDAVQVTESFDERGPTYQRDRRSRRARQGDRPRRPHRQGDPHGRACRRLAPEPGGPRRLRGLMWTSRRSPSAASPRRTASTARSPSQNRSDNPDRWVPGSDRVRSEPAARFTVRVRPPARRPIARDVRGDRGPHGRRGGSSGTDLLVPEDPGCRRCPRGVVVLPEATGCTVRTESGRVLGTVAEVLAYPGAGPLARRRRRRDRDADPRVDAFVVSVDLVPVAPRSSGTFRGSRPPRTTA